MLRNFRAALFLLTALLFITAFTSCSDRSPSAPVDPRSAVAGVHAPTLTPTTTAATATATAPRTLDQLMSLAYSDINGFWQRTFASRQTPYSPPAGLTPYNAPTPTGCGETVPDNAFYCPSDGRIYYDQAFMQQEMATIGDYGPVFILAHEWGHLVQKETGILQDPRLLTIQVELQADCFAGAYSQDAERRHVLDRGDLEEAATSLIQAGDPAGTPWYDPRAHGTARERIDSFSRGFEGGVSACL